MQPLPEELRRFLRERILEMFPTLLAFCNHSGISAATLNRWLSGKSSSPSARGLANLCAALTLNYKELMLAIDLGIVDRNKLCSPDRDTCATTEVKVAEGESAITSTLLAAVIDNGVKDPELFMTLLRTQNAAGFTLSTETFRSIIADFHTAHLPKTDERKE